MQEWRIKQEIYHRLNQEYTDDLNRVDIRITDTVVEDAARHFVESIDEWIYPSKSYFVAVCYAHWISIDYNEDFYELLNNPMLLAGNDPYFVTYNDDKETYDAILEYVEFPLPMTGMVPDVKEYYNAEIGPK